MKINFFSIEHYIMMIILFSSVLLGLLFVKKRLDTEKKLHTFLVIISAISLSILVLSRINDVYHNINENVLVDFFGQKRPYNWFMLFPNSFCSLIGLITPIIIFTKKYKNNKLLEAFYSMAILGLITNIIYPEYIARLPFFQIRVYGAILYHVLCGFIYLALLLTNNLNPKLKNWYYTPIALLIMIGVGTLELIHFNFAEAFNITHYLVAGFWPSSLGVLCIGYVIFDILIRLFFERIEKH